MKVRQQERGVTLVISLIMLLVLTLLVVSAIRFGNVNLKISGNMQSQSEATAASQVQIESVLEKIADPTVNIDAITGPNPLPFTVDTGGATYTGVVKPLKCVFAVPVEPTTLNPKKAADLPCIESLDSDKVIGSDGLPVAPKAACSQQQWDIETEINDPVTGTKVTMLQGVAVRVPAQVLCTD